MKRDKRTARKEKLGSAAPQYPEEMKGKVELRIGDRAVVIATARTTPVGLISVGVMVAAILLSATALVHAARRKL